MVDVTEFGTNGVDANALADAIFGNGVNVLSASYSGDNRSAGIYEDGDANSPGVTPSDTGVILSTGQVSQFYNNSGSNPNIRANTTTNTTGQNNEAGFNALAGASTFDAAYMDFTIEPAGDVLKMQFVFSSEEYPEFSNSIYNDVVGVWLDGTPVPLAIGDGTTSVGNVNQVDNINLFNDNTGDSFFTEMDGFTVTLSLTIPVTAGNTYDLRIGIADVGDSSYDSNLLIAGDSLQTELIAVDDTIRLDANTSKTFDPTTNDTTATAGSISITHINGIEVVANQVVPLANGQSVQLNPDGTLTIIADSDEEIAPFSYTITDGTNTDTAFVNVSTIPCFVAGTRIMTPKGERLVETLCPGDLVLTLDNGAQPLRWVGQRRVAAKGVQAPIRIAPHTFGVHRRLMVSPQHRIVIRDPAAELFFGDQEVLVAAKHLVNGGSVQVREGGSVDYVHLLFDAHQVVISDGLPSESFLPGPQASELFDDDTLDEIGVVLPWIDPRSGAGYSQAARRILKSHEAMVLMSARQTQPMPATWPTLSEAA